MPSPSVLHVEMAMKAIHGVILANCRVPFYGTVAKLAMRQRLSYSKALHFKNSAYQAHFAQGSP
jgi:hypothetical protein